MISTKIVFVCLISAGVLWTGGLLWFDWVIRRDPGRYGLIGDDARAAGPRAAAVICALLTLLLGLFLVRSRIGVPEIVTIAAAGAALTRWLVATVRLLRRTGRRAPGSRKPG